jgi:peptidoglycan/LPS O-acetylase OafA/YrhL
VSDVLQTPRAHTLAGLDGVRALAALSIVALHVGFHSGTYESGPWGSLVAHLDSGVAIFFVLSGFLLYRPFALAHLRRADAPSASRYMVRRFLRVFPAYWAALLGCAYVLNRVALDTASQVAVHLSLTRIYFADYFFAGMPQVWTLAVEVSFYLALPALALAIGTVSRDRDPRRTLTSELLALAVLYALGLGTRIALLATHSGATISTKWLPAELDWFALGMALAVVSAGVAAGSVSASGVARVVRSTAVWWGFALACLWLAAYATGTGADVALFRKETTDLQDVAQQVLYGLFGFGVVAPIALGPPGVGLARRVLSSRPATVLGLASYGIFLWHVELLNWLVDRHQVQTWVPSARFASVFGIVAGLSAALGLASYLLIEKPLGRWAARVTAARVK